MIPIGSGSATGGYGGALKLVMIIVGRTGKMKSIMVISILQSWMLSTMNMILSAESTDKNA